MVESEDEGLTSFAEGKAGGPGACAWGPTGFGDSV